MMIPDVSFVVSYFLRSLIRTDIMTCLIVQLVELRAQFDLRGCWYATMGKHTILNA